MFKLMVYTDLPYLGTILPLWAPLLQSSKSSPRYKGCVTIASPCSTPRRISMKVANAVAEILKREGIEFLIGHPVNPIIEAAAEADIRTIMVRQERIGLHMCDAIAKVTSGDRIGVFAMQHGPGTENAFGGVAQSYGDSCPVVVLDRKSTRLNSSHSSISYAVF